MGSIRLALSFATLPTCDDTSCQWKKWLSGENRHSFGMFSVIPSQIDQNFLFKSKGVLWCISESPPFAEPVKITKELFSFSLNDYLYGLLGINRASGTMIWPIYYLIFITGIIYIFRYFSEKKSTYIIRRNF